MATPSATDSPTVLAKRLERQVTSQINSSGYAVRRIWRIYGLGEREVLFVGRRQGANCAHRALTAYVVDGEREPVIAEGW